MITAAEGKVIEFRRRDKKRNFCIFLCDSVACF